jgi:hypothetical protein
MKASRVRSRVVMATFSHATGTYRQVVVWCAGRWNRTIPMTPAIHQLHILYDLMLFADQHPG